MTPGSGAAAGDAGNLLSKCGRLLPDVPCAALCRCQWHLAGKLTVFSPCV
jgi:hypothetical protein